MASIGSLDADISALKLPNDAETVRLSHGAAIVSLTDFAKHIIAAGIHPDDDTQVEIGAENKAWRSAVAPVAPVITSCVANNLALHALPRASVYAMRRCARVG